MKYKQLNVVRNESRLALVMRKSPEIRVILFHGHLKIG